MVRVRAGLPSRILRASRSMGCVKKCEQSLVFFCVVTLPEGQRRLGVYPRPVPGCGNRVQSGVAFGCTTPRHIPLLQTVLVRGCETIGGNTSRSLRKRRNFPQRHYPNTRRYDPWIDEYYYRDNIREIPRTYIDFHGPNAKWHSYLSDRGQCPVAVPHHQDARAYGKPSAGPPPCGCPGRSRSLNTLTLGRYADR